MQGVEDRIVVVIWIRLVPGRDNLHLRVHWPRSYNADGLCMYSGFSPKDATIFAIKRDIATRMEQGGKLVGENMCIDTLEKVNEEQPDVNWKEIRANLADMGEQYSNFRCKVFNRRMILELKVPSNGFPRRKTTRLCFWIAPMAGPVTMRTWKWIASERLDRMDPLHEVHIHVSLHII